MFLPKIRKIQTKLPYEGDFCIVRICGQSDTFDPFWNDLDSFMCLKKSFFINNRFFSIIINSILESTIHLGFFALNIQLLSLNKIQKVSKGYPPLKFGI